uniref:Fungal lipase-type domain-containing protein n=1 Tax=Alexandrium catenella TaxID=2925 RepID=A0A7S1WHT5_ALECA|mmetsp:Transcript_62007/g.165917  ORF Transcript_62007/g.165917 Transcript_62007/m.165917 type:complete len:508 (+) Transcript_62007:79-1602(+)
MSWLRSALLAVAVALPLAAAAAEAQPPAACAAEAVGGCEEAEVERLEEAEAELLRVELLQQAVRGKKEVVEELSQGAEGVLLEFALSMEEFASAGELVPKKLHAAGVPVAEFVPRFLRIETAGGAELRQQPEAKDFPLRLRYEPRAEGALRRKAAHALRQDGGAGRLWSRRRRSEPHAKPDASSYRATSEEVDLQTLATNVYDFTQPDPTCYKREEYHTLTDENWGGQDNVAVYSCQCDSCMTTPAGDGLSLLQSNGSAASDSALSTASSGNATANASAGRKARSCVFAVSGSNDLLDWSSNVDALWNGEFCGKDKYHRGFADEASQIANKAGFISLATRMKTCDRLVIVGHSLGGAVASLLAECIDCQDCKKPAALQGIGVEAELYTFGAPSVYDGPAPTNGHASDGVFKGRRFWNYDMRSCIHRWCSSWCCWSLGSQDPVPYVAQKVGYRHPKIESVGLDEHGEVEVWRASSEASTLEPDSFQWPSVMEHMNSNYIARIKAHLAR